MQILIAPGLEASLKFPQQAPVVGASRVPRNAILTRPSGST